MEREAAVSGFMDYFYCGKAHGLAFGNHLPGKSVLQQRVILLIQFQAIDLELKRSRETSLCCQTSLLVQLADSSRL